MIYFVTYAFDGKTLTAELQCDDDDTALQKARLYYGHTARVWREKF